MNETTNHDKMEKIVSLCKRRGFIFQGSEIYGGLAGTFDYGPLGVLLKKNIQNSWWKHFVTDRDDMFGIDAAILMNPRAWEASGHVGGFSDPMVECESCKKRFRSDHLIQNMDDYLSTKRRLVVLIEDINPDVDKSIKAGAKTLDEFNKAFEFAKELGLDLSPGSVMALKLQALLDEANKNINEAKQDNEKVLNLIDTLNQSNKYLGLAMQIYLNNYVKCPNCSLRKWGESRPFNMMFKTQVGATEDPTSISYLRPETAGGMFVNFKNVVDSLHPKLPFGLAQIGKAFRNEIAPRDFIFRLRELEQMEIEYFCHESKWEESFEHLRQQFSAWMISIGLPADKIHEIEIGDGDRAHYSKRTIDFEFDFPIGQKELAGLAYRTDFDLKAHSEYSKTDLSYFDEELKERFIPHCIEPSVGVERTFLAVLSSAYDEEVVGEETRTVLRFVPSIAPVQIAVLPLSKKEELSIPAQAIAKTLKKFARVTYDETQSIGKRYRRQDEIGTPYCVTVDFDTLTDNAVTVRDRDTMEQVRIPVLELESYFSSKIL